MAITSYRATGLASIAKYPKGSTPKLYNYSQIIEPQPTLSETKDITQATANATGASSCTALEPAQRTYDYLRNPFIEPEADNHCYDARSVMCADR